MTVRDAQKTLAMADGFNWSSSTAAGSDHDCDDGHHQGSSANNEQAPSVCHGQGDHVRIAAAAACPLGVAAQLPAKDVTTEPTVNTSAGSGSVPDTTAMARFAYSESGVSASQSCNPVNSAGHHCPQCSQWSRSNVFKCQCLTAQYLERQRDRCPFGCGERLGLMDDWAYHKHLRNCEMRNPYARKKLRAN